MSEHEETAIFAGGCFWCMVQPFDTLPGIKQVISGYTGGHVANPTYEQVKAHKTVIPKPSKSFMIQRWFPMLNWWTSTGNRLIQPMPWANSKTAATTTAQ